MWGAYDGTLLRSGGGSADGRTRPHLTTVVADRTESEVEMNRPLRIAMVLLVVAIVLAVIGAVLKALRWLLYVAIVVLVIAAAVRWLVGSDRD